MTYLNNTVKLLPTVLSVEQETIVVNINLASTSEYNHGQVLSKGLMGYEQVAVAP